MPSGQRTSRYTRYADAIQPSSIRALETLAARQPDLISFGPGRPDDSLFPADPVGRAYAETLTSLSHHEHPLNYAPTEGLRSLREWLAAQQRARGRLCEAGNVLITNGSQQAIHLLTKLLVEPGDVVLVQAPTYPGALQIFEANRAQTRSLEEFRASPTSSRPALIYAMADFQNPTGACLNLDERHDLLALARRLDTFLVEDNAYEVLRYEGERLPALAELDAAASDEGRTLYVGSFSKCAAPGLRLGWVVGPQELIARLALIKQTEDLQASTLSQAVLVRMVDHIMGSHAALLRDRYRDRRDRMLAALDRHVGNRATWAKPTGGFFVWLTLDRGIDTATLLPSAIEAGVAYVPGSSFFHDGTGHNHLRISFSAVASDRIDEGIRRLAAVLDRQLA